MEKRNQIRKYVWAVDAFAEAKELQRRTLETLAAMAGPEAVIEPLGVIQWEDRYVLAKPPRDMEAIERAAREEIEHLKSGSKAKFSPTIILRQESLSLGNAINRVVMHAKGAGADAIAVGTHGRSGASRFLLGSFAETLVLRSDVPTLVVSPDTKATKHIDHILFPVDFSAESTAGFYSVMSLAKETRARITLLHVDLREDPRAARLRAEPMLEAAKTMGVQVGFVAHPAVREIARAILQTAEQTPSTMIAMISKAGPLGAVLVGSITRQVIRQSPSPVWVLHPRNVSQTLF